MYVYSTYIRTSLTRCRSIPSYTISNLIGHNTCVGATYSSVAINTVSSTC